MKCALFNYEILFKKAMAFELYRPKMLKYAITVGYDLYRLNLIFLKYMSLKTSKVETVKSITFGLMEKTYYILKLFI